MNNENKKYYIIILLALCQTVLPSGYCASKKDSHKCPNNDEINYYRKYGKIQLNDNHIICILSNDSIDVKVLFDEKCNIVYRSIKRKDNCARSFAKYDNNKLMSFDSTDINCKHLMEYYYGYGLKSYGDINELPKYLLKDLKKD